MPKIRFPAFLVVILLLLPLVTPLAVRAQNLDTVESPQWWDLLEMTPLFEEPTEPGGAPADWSVVGGDATYQWKKDPAAREGTSGYQLHGSGRAYRNAFLTSPRDYGDFLLEVEVRIDAGGNSGIQVRSRERNAHLVGYQIEIDSSPRRWSGGLYDEARRGWLASLEDNADAREAFAVGKWNTYRILCVGPRIRTWINGVPAVDHLDFMDLSGRIGFQVHSGRCDVYWRNARIADLGVREWRPLISPGRESGYQATPPNGLRPVEGGFEVAQDGVVVALDESLPGGISVLAIRGFVESGTMGLELGDQEDPSRSSYVLRVPAPFGEAGPGRPGLLQVVQDIDGTTAIVSGSTLVPGPPALDDPLPVEISFTPGSVARLVSVDVLPPTEAETIALRKARTKAEKRGSKSAPAQSP
ncbi:MAG: DUF1080 domain-containing protein [Phycisphaerales bacterium]|nr:DUF1080 domain-containing protein [Phycisphaerales bacterium]